MAETPQRAALCLELATSLSSYGYWIWNPGLSTTKLHHRSNTMKLSIGLGAALVSFAAAAQQAAKVYIFPPPEAASASMPPSVARLILLQRIAALGKGPSIHDIPEDIDTESVVDLMNQFGRTSVQLFDGHNGVAPSQLVMMLEGMTETQMQELGATFDTKSAFTITNPPTSSAHEKLVKNDFYNVGITNEKECSIGQVTNPFEKSCWNGKAAVAKYDVSKVSTLTRHHDIWLLMVF